MLEQLKYTLMALNPALSGFVTFARGLSNDNGHICAKTETSVNSSCIYLSNLHMSASRKVSHIFCLDSI